jgi:cystathionine gamma-lyase
MISFRIATPSTSNSVSTVATFLKSLKLFTLAESLGGVESLIEIPAQMTHGSIPEIERAQLGITDDLIRMSIGVEDPEDLVRDIEEALEVAVYGSSPSASTSNILLETGPLTTPITEDDSPLGSGAPSESGDRPTL